MKEMKIIRNAKLLSQNEPMSVQQFYFLLEVASPLITFFATHCNNNDQQHNSKKVHPDYNKLAKCTQTNKLYSK